MAYDESDYYDDLRDEYESGLIEEALKEQSEDPVALYLATYGDAVQGRVSAAQTDASSLTDLRKFGSALVRSMTGLELAIRFLVLRPTLQGFFPSDPLAQVLTRRVVGGRSAEDRELLPLISRHWELDIDAILLSSGEPLWSFVQQRLIPARNLFVHTGEEVPAALAQLGAEALGLVLTQIVEPLAKRLHFVWPEATWAAGTADGRIAGAPSNPW